MSRSRLFKERFRDIDQKEPCSTSGVRPEMSNTQIGASIGTPNGNDKLGLQIVARSFDRSKILTQAAVQCTITSAGGRRFATSETRNCHARHTRRCRGGHRH